MNPLIPNFLDDFKFKEIKKVEISNLFVGLLSKNNSIDYVRIKNTPHHKFAQSYIFDSSNKEELKNEYINYLNIQPTEHSVEKFESLIDNIKINGYDFKTTPILVWRHWTRPLPLKRYDVADGFHRLAVLSALGYLNICVTMIEKKDNVYKRAINRIIK